MGESLIPIAEIAEFIIQLQRDVRALKAKQRLKEKEFELESGEEPQDVGGQLPSTSSDYKTPITVVTSIINESCIMVRRQIPDAGGEGWANDPELVTELEVTLPTGVSAPDVGRIVQPVYTGLFQKFTGGTTVSLPRYGLFGAGGGALKQYLVVEELDEHLRCRTLVGSAPTTPALIGTTDVFVAKPFRLRRTPWDGTQIASITYNYSPLSAGGNGHRKATFGNTPSQEDEIQKIVPTYIVSFDIIYAGVVDGGTDITIVTTVTSVGTITQRLTILDFNTDSRMFMRISPAD